MIKSILYVEDGSVDVDQLYEDLGEDVYVVVYRQGSQPPTLIQPENPLQSFYDGKCIKLENKIEKVVKMLNSTLSMKMSKKVRSSLEDIFIELM